MIGIKLDPFPFEEESKQTIPIQFHPSFLPTYKHLRNWAKRFSGSSLDTILNDLLLFYSLAKRKHLDHRDPHHISRIILSIYHTRRKLLSSAALQSTTRHAVIRWMPTNLNFPFASKKVMGCLMGFNIMDRCELFDEENIVVSLQKHFPEFQFVKESYYHHSSQEEGIRICYFEVEKKDGTPFSLSERKLITQDFKNKMKNSIQRLIPSMFMKLNQEEVYKNILILSQEITSVNDLPQVSITLDQYTGKEIAFHVTLVQIAPFHHFSFKERFLGCTIILERVIPVRHLNGHQIEASIFRILLPHEPSLVRSDGSLDFYAARQIVSQHLLGAIGEFRDYNGGLLIKQQELLYSFKENLPAELSRDSELTEIFFHGLVPLEKQALLDPHVLSQLFGKYVSHKKETIINGLSILVDTIKDKTFIHVRSNDPSITDTINATLRNYLPNTKDWAYNILQTSEEVSFNCVLLNSSSNHAENFILSIQRELNKWSQKRQDEQFLRVALGHSMFSLDPRIGGETVSSEVLKLLFEGLTRINTAGHVENGVAESITTSSDLKQYTFKLRPSFWNDGSLVSAHDFAYSWKRILSPDFKTSFATYFYPIINAKEAKEGKVSLDKIGIHVIDDRTLRIDLVHPAPYFLQLIAKPIFSPIHRFVDKERPQWPYQSEISYPCNGPFQLKVNQSNQAYLLTKNHLYWDAAQIKLEKISLTSMDTYQATQAFLRNEVDWIGDPFGPWYHSSIPERGALIHSPHSYMCWLVFNTLSPSFDHPKIRKALALSIDRSSLVKETTRNWSAAYSVQLPVSGVQQQKVFPSYNQKEANILLLEGLSELGIPLNDFSFELTFTKKSILESVAYMLKEQLEKTLGIKCELKSFSWNTFFHKVTEGQYQICLLNWIPPITDPIGILNVFRYPQEKLNFSGWESPEFQNLLDLSEEGTSPFQRSSYLYKAEKVLANDLPIVPLFYQSEEAIIRNSFYEENSPENYNYFNQIKTISKRR